MLLGKWLWERQVTAGGLQGEEWAQVNVWRWCPSQEQAQEATSWTTGTCVVTWRDTLTGWLRLCHTLTLKFRRIASCKLLPSWLLLKRWSMLSLWLLSPSTSLTLENKSVSVLTVTPQQPSHCPASIPHPWAAAPTFAACSRIVEAPQRVSRFTEYFGVFWLAKDRASWLPQSQTGAPALQPLQLPSKGQSLENAPSRNNCRISLPCTFCAFLCPSYWGNSH